MKGKMPKILLVHLFCLLQLGPNKLIIFYIFAWHMGIGTCGTEEVKNYYKYYALLEIQAVFSIINNMTE